MAKKIAKVIALMGALAAGAAGKAVAQSVDDSFYNRTGDFVFVTSYMNQINRNENTNLNAMIRGGNIKKIYAVDAIEGIKSRLKFLYSDRAKKFYGNEELRNDLLGRYQSFLSELSKQKLPGKKSLEALSSAVSDGTIEPKELGNVEDGVYIIVKEGTDKVTGPYYVPALVRLVTETNPNAGKNPNTLNADIIDEQSGKYDEQVKKIVDEILSQKEIEAKAQTPPALLTPLPPADYNVPVPKNYAETPIETPKEIPSTQTQTNSVLPVSLVFGGNSNFDFNSFGGSLGVRLNSAKDKNFGLTALLDVGTGLDNQTDSTSLTYFDDVYNTDITLAGTKNNSNKFSIGGSLEISYGPLILGGGVAYNSWIENTNEEISAGDIMLKSNSFAVPNSTLSEKIYGGLSLPIGDNYKLEAIAGYDTQSKFFFGLRNAIRLNPSKE